MKHKIEGCLSVDYTFSHMLNGIVKDGKSINTRNSITKRLTGLNCAFFSTPLISIRKTAWKSALREMEWFLSGSSNINDLHKSVHPWWQPWADLSGEIKNNYSKQFRHFNDPGQKIPGEAFDQIQFFLDAIKNHPYSRRSVMTTWNPAEMADPSTPITNCHGTVIQAFCDEANNLEILMYQRSSDMLLGLPHNWIQYWAFLLWVAAQTDKTPYKLSWVGGDCHVYEEHLPLVKEISKKLPSRIFTPSLIYKGVTGGPFRADDFELDQEYKPIITTKAKMII